MEPSSEDLRRDLIHPVVVAEFSAADGWAIKEQALLNIKPDIVIEDFKAYLKK